MKEMVKKEKKSSRRAHGEGSVSLRADGRYQAQMVLEDGKRKYFYGKTKKEALDKLHKAQEEQRKGILATGPDQTVEQFLEDWLENVHKHTIRLATYIKYHQLLQKHVYPVIGYIKLQKLTAQHLEVMYARKVQDGLLGTVRITHRVLHKAFADGVRWRRMAINPCNDIALPKRKKREIAPLTKEQAQKLLDIAKGHWLEGFLTVAIATGMRRGEILALRWSDVDLENKRLVVQRSVNRVGKVGLVVSEPKTESSKRTIMLPQFVTDMLIVHLGRQVARRREAGGRWQENNLVFPNSAGNFIEVSDLHRAFKKLLKEAGLPDMRIHDLRHSAATILLGMKAHPKLVQELLGHSNISMTMDTYSHVLPSMQRGMMDDLNDLFKR